MVLWQKECRSENGCYNELFPTGSSLNNPVDRHLAKNDSLSSQFRADGNKKFKANLWREAMELYNKSLRFATERSENISLAYANRSACFLYLKKYNECLIDVELAKQANYPQRLMSKLDQRKADCLKQMSIAPQAEKRTKPVMLFAPNDKFACMANVLEIRTNDEFGKHIVTNQNLEVGQIIFAEEVFVCELENRERSNCETCLRPMMNFSPCSGCSDAMFCSDHCLKLNCVHEIECGSLYSSIPGAKQLLQTIYLGISAFDENIEELMKFVEKCVFSRDFNSLEDVEGKQLAYGRFLKLAALQKEKNPNVVSSVYQIALLIPKIKQLFDKKQKQRFLMHLLLQNYRVIQTNGMVHRTRETNEDIRADISFLGIFFSLFNHACYHNMNMQLYENQIIGYVTRPIEKGEQIFVRYEHFIYRFSLNERRKFLWEKFKFECKCSLCVPCVKPSDVLKMQSDPIYQMFGLASAETSLTDPKRREFFRETFRQFLCKYGRLPYSLEIHQAQIGFSICFSENFEFL